jgi:hypothetical protein
VVHEPQAHLAVTQLHAAYADIATRRAWDELGDIVTSDARFTFDLGGRPPVELVGPEALGQFGSRATGSFGFYSYQPLNAVLTRVGDGEATGRSYALEVALVRPGNTWLEVYGAYDDAYVAHHGRWLFTDRSFRTLARRLDTHPTIPTPG